RRAAYVGGGIKMRPSATTGENNDCSEWPVCYFAPPFRFGGNFPAGGEKAEWPQNQALVRVGRGGRNNIEMNPVFRGMVRSTAAGRAVNSWKRVIGIGGKEL